MDKNKSEGDHRGGKNRVKFTVVLQLLFRGEQAIEAGEALLLTGKT